MCGNCNGKVKIITFSGKARHGKDSSLLILKKLLEGQEKKPLSINYADHLKEVLIRYFGWDGVKDEKGRSLLQDFAEEVRERFPDYWVDHVIGVVKVFEPYYDYVLIGDCRYLNEIDKWKDLKYEIITVHVNRPDFDNSLTPKQKTHPSENALNGFNYLVQLENTTLEELETEIKLKLLPIVLKAV